MANYSVTITNGAGTQIINPGEYTVSSSYAPVYNAKTLSSSYQNKF